MATQLPSTVTTPVMRMAIAWAIVESVDYSRQMAGQDLEDKRQAMTDAYIKTYNAILNGESSSKGSSVQE